MMMVMIMMIEETEQTRLYNFYEKNHQSHHHHSMRKKNIFQKTYRQPQNEREEGRESSSLPITHYHYVCMNGS